MDNWRREQYRLHAKLPVYKRHVTKAIEIVREAIKIQGVWNLSCSGGKDSVAMLDLCCVAGWRGPVLHFYYPEMPGENTKLVKQLTADRCLDLHLLPVVGEWDVYDSVGFFIHPETPEQIKAANAMAREYKKQVAEYVEQQGWIGQFIGLTRHESRGRNLMLSKKGYIYKTENRKTWTACPLRDWTGADVWAYIFERNLPYLSCYDKADDPERERSEITWFIAESAWRHGMISHLKRTNPCKFNELALRWQEIRRYV